ncbi:hypothetical protein ACTA71_002910 [Dictyostelium dimigraforme]
MTIIAISIMNVVIGLAILGVILRNKIMPNQKIQRIFILGVQGILIVLSGIMLIGCEGTDIINRISPYINMVTVYSNNVNINIGYSIDGISAIFIFLTIILILSCNLISIRVIKEKTEQKFQIMLLLTEILIINFFAATDLVQLYIVYEATLIPMVIMIGVWGSRTEKKIAAFQILIYTLIGSIFMLMSIGILYSTLGTTDYIMIREYIDVLPENLRKLIFIGFFIGFAVKIPIAPLHLWLLRAHVEAPTAGSVLLAGILLKLGGYGYIRYNIGLFPELCEYYFPIIGGICLISILYTGIATLTQLDVKRIVAYSSISHMNVIVLGLFSGVLQGLEGGIILMIGHGVVSGGLFLCIGVIYDRCKTRIVYAYNNLVHVMPIMAILFFLLVLGNIAFPITSNFVGELLIFIGLIKKNIIIAFFSALSMIVTAIYSFWLYNRIFFVNEIIQRESNEVISSKGQVVADTTALFLKKDVMKKKGERGMDDIGQPKVVKKEQLIYSDVNIFEFTSIALMIIMMIIIGMKPSVVEGFITINCLELIIPLIIMILLSISIKEESNRMLLLFKSLKLTLILIIILLMLEEAIYIKLNGHLIKTELIAFVEYILLGVSYMIISMFEEGVKEGRKTKITEEALILMYSSLIGMLISMEAHNLITLFLSLEITSICFYILALNKNSRKVSIEGGLKYYIIGGIASTIILLGIVSIYKNTGSLMYTDILIIGMERIGNYQVQMGIALIVLGLIIKLGVAPFHGWLIDTYEGTGMLMTFYLTITQKIVTIIVLINLYKNLITYLNLEVLNKGLVVLILVTLIVGTVGSLRQQKLIRFIAYSAIVNSALLILFFVGNNTEELITYSIYYLINYIIGLAVLINIIIGVVKTKNGGNIEILSELKNIWLNNKVIGISLIIVLIYLAGLPPFTNFISKIILILPLIVEDKKQEVGVETYKMTKGGSIISIVGGLIWIIVSQIYLDEIISIIKIIVAIN